MFDPKYKFKNKHMKSVINTFNVAKFSEQIKDLDGLLTERISELHQVKGMQQCRHAYIYYRSLLWEARDTIINNVKEVKQPNQEVKRPGSDAAK